MKRNLLILILALSVCFALQACRDDNIDEQIKSNIESNYLPKNNENSANDLYYADYNEETEYIPASDKEFNGIVAIPYGFTYSGYSFNNDRYYFSATKNVNTNSSSFTVDMLNYIDLLTGEQHYICPDPLCLHSAPEECKYIELANNCFFTDNNVFYTFRQDITKNQSLMYLSFSMYKADLNKGIVENIYKCKDSASKNHLFLKALRGSDLYFQEYTRNETSESAKMMKESIVLSVYNTDSGKVRIINDFPEEYVDKSANLFYADEDNLYFISLTDIFTTDLSLENERLVYKLKENENFGSCYYDKETEELFFNVFNAKEKRGCMYVYANGVLDELDMPSENIYCFQLTKSTIYYSEYAPLFYGISSMGGEVYDYSGGKIYAANRNNRKESELIYDGGKDFIIANDSIRYIIIGDYLYFDYLKIENTGGTVDPIYSGCKIRINPKENTIKYLKFE